MTTVIRNDGRDNRELVEHDIMKYSGNEEHS